MLYNSMYMKYSEHANPETEETSSCLELGLGLEGNEKSLLKGIGVLLGDKNILNIDCSDDCTTVNILKPLNCIL